MLGILDMVGEAGMVGKSEFSTVPGAILSTRPWHEAEEGCCALSVPRMLLRPKDAACGADRGVDNRRGLRFNIPS